jgi:hypothetical protein
VCTQSANENVNGGHAMADKSLTPLPGNARSAPSLCGDRP